MGRGGETARATGMSFLGRRILSGSIVCRHMWAYEDPGVGEGSLRWQAGGEHPALGLGRLASSPSSDITTQEHRDKLPTFSSLGVLFCRMKAGRSPSLI